MVKEDEIDLNIIEDLLCRFIINLPKEEQTTDRLFFHIQAAHWFYTDFYVNNNEIVNAGCKVPHCNFKAFSRVIFKHCPFLKTYFEFFEVFFQRFNQYISQIPVYGGIILNSNLDKILLVTNYKNTSYSFPKGKINQNETGIECAVREVWEETGIDISRLISEKDFIEFKMGGNKTQKMYVVCGVDENTLMFTNTRGEIGRIEWVNLSEIDEGKNSYIFQKILPFIRPLKLWIRDFASVRGKDKDKPRIMEAVITEPEPIVHHYVEATDEFIISFSAKLSAVMKEFDRKLQHVDEDKEDENKKNNPFLNFKLDRESLREAFRSKN